MCLTVDKSYKNQGDTYFGSQKAHRDIYTLKLATNITKTKCKGFYNEDKIYKFNHLYHSYLEGYTNKRTSMQEITTGLYSFISWNYLNKSMFWFDKSPEPRGIILCKIPKDSKYYIGIEGDIVSMDLILLEPILVNDANKYKLPHKTKDISSIACINIKELQDISGVKLGLKNIKLVGTVIKQGNYINDNPKTIININN